MNNFNPNGGQSLAQLFTVADVAARLNLTPQPKGKYHGAPEGTGATKDGFVLCPEGNAFTNSGEKYTSKQVAELAGISPDQYEPVALWRAANGAPAQLPQTTPKPAQSAVKSPANAPFDWKSATVYRYPDEAGKTLFEVARIGEGEGKRLSQRKPDGSGGYDYKLGEVRRVLYRLPEVLAAQTVFICEGEKAADAVNQSLAKTGQSGFIATTNPHGAGKWRDEYAETLAGKSVIVLPDNDMPGRSHAETVCKSCASAGATVKRIELPNLPDKGDAADFLASGGSVETLAEMSNAAPTWTPPAAPRRFPRFTLGEIFTRPRLEYLIQGMFVEQGTGVVSADYGGFKSFVALDMGLCVATGRQWMHRATKRGSVVYITPEGSYQHADRVKAWMKFHGITELPENFEIIELPVQIGDAAQCQTLIDELRELKPAFIILDTVAKCNIGRDENDAAAMGLFTDGMEKIARELGAFVLAIHHNNKSGTARGSVSLPANVDASITLRRGPNRIVTIGCDRIKGAPFEAFSLVGQIVETGETDENSVPITSLVFEPTDTPTAAIPQADQTREQVLEVLREAGPDGLTATEWQKKTELSNGGFYNILKELEGQVTKKGKIYSTTPFAPNGVNGVRKFTPFTPPPFRVEQMEFAGVEEVEGKSKAKRRAKNSPDAEPYTASIADNDREVTEL